MKIGKLVTATAVVLAAATALAASALAASEAVTAKGLTGVWSGKTHQDIEPLGPDADFVEWRQRITVRALGGRLTYLGVSVRYTCPSETNPMAGDIRLNLGWGTKGTPGPVLTKNGGFALVVRHAKDFNGVLRRLPIPVHISGVLGRGSAGGRFDLSGGGCSRQGTLEREAELLSPAKRGPGAAPGPPRTGRRCRRFLALRRRRRLYTA